jgi:hypothetical protein
LICNTTEIIDFSNLFSSRSLSPYIRRSTSTCPCLACQIQSTPVSSSSSSRCLLFPPSPPAHRASPAELLFVPLRPHLPRRSSGSSLDLPKDYPSIHPSIPPCPSPRLAFTYTHLLPDSSPYWIPKARQPLRATACPFLPARLSTPLSFSLLRDQHNIRAGLFFLDSDGT